jgi:hypothetical protein
VYLALLLAYVGVLRYLASKPMDLPAGVSADVEPSGPTSPTSGARAPLQGV